MRQPRRRQKSGRAGPKRKAGRPAAAKGRPRRKAPPQGIFISYARADAAAFAKRLARDIEKRGGHRVWIDRRNIRQGALWDVSIEQGILNASVVGAVVTKYAVRKTSVCRDEVCFALVNDKEVVPLLRQQKVPLILPLARRQFIDFTGKYEDGLSALLRYLAGDMAALREPRVPTVTGVVPLDFSVEIAKKSAGFTGRKWVEQELDRWLAGGGNRVFVIVAEPGVGKSAIAAWLGKTRTDDVVGIYFCTHQLSRSLDPQQFVACLVGQLCAKLPGLAEAVEARHPAVRRPTAADAFRELVVEPAATLPPPTRPQLIIVDSLDEAASQEGETVLDVLVKHAPDLPAWLRVLATTRPEEPVLSRIRALGMFALSADRPENLSDLDRYIAARLASAALAERVGTGAAAVARQIESRAEGNFLYACLVLDALADGSLAEADVGQLAPGLAAFYGADFSRRFPDLDAYADQYAALLRVLAAARGPLSFSLLARVSGEPAEVLNRRLLRLRSYLRVAGRGEAVRYGLFHKSLQEWLTDREAAGLYWCDASTGHAQLAEVLLGDWRADEYALRHLPGHLVETQRWPDLERLLSAPAFVDARRAAGLTCEMVADLATAARRDRLTPRMAAAFVQAYEPHLLESLRQQLRGVLNESFGRYQAWPPPLRKCLESRRHLHVMLFLGDTHNMEGRQEDAIRVFKRMKRQARGRSHFAYATGCNRLAYIYEQQERLGDAMRELDEVVLKRDAQARYGPYYLWALHLRGIVLRRLGRYDEARDALDRVARGSRLPGHPTSARHQLGIIDMELGDLDEAEQEFLRCQGARGEGKYDHRRAYEHRRLGQIYALTGREAAARQAFDQAIAVSTASANQRYVDLTHQDILKFLEIPAALATERPEEVSLARLARRFGIDPRGHEGHVADAFHVLRRRGNDYLDIINAKSARPTGKAARADVVHRKGLWHAAVMLLIVDHRRRVALQKRGEADSRGKWDVSVAGHQDVGEGDVVTAVREAAEEVGLKVSPGRLVRVFAPYQFRKVGHPKVACDGHESQFVYRYGTDKVNRERLSLFVLMLAPGEEKQVAAGRGRAATAIAWLPLAEAAERARRQADRYASAFKHLLHPATLREISRLIGEGQGAARRK